MNVHPPVAAGGGPDPSTGAPSPGRATASADPRESALVDALTGDVRALVRRDPRAFGTALRQAFGTKTDRATLAALADDVAGGAGPPMPAATRFVPAGELGKGPGGGPVHGAYDPADGGTILLDGRLRDDPERLRAVFVEELGHHLDRALGGEDAVGDEGAIFARALLDGPLDASAVRALRSERDHGTVSVGGRVRDVEFSEGGFDADAFGFEPFDADGAGFEAFDADGAGFDAGSLELFDDVSVPDFEPNAFDVGTGAELPSFEAVAPPGEGAGELDVLDLDATAALAVPVSPENVTFDPTLGTGGAALSSPDAPLAGQPAVVPAGKLAVPDPSGKVSDEGASLPPPPLAGWQSASYELFSPEAGAEPVVLGAGIGSGLELAEKLWQNRGKVFDRFKGFNGKAQQLQLNYLNYPTIGTVSGLQLDVVANRVDDIGAENFLAPLGHLNDASAALQAPGDTAHGLDVSENRVESANVEVDVENAQIRTAQNGANRDRVELTKPPHWEERDAAAKIAMEDLFAASHDDGNPVDFYFEQWRTLKDTEGFVRAWTERHGSFPTTFDEALETDGFFRADTGGIGMGTTGHFVLDGKYYPPLDGRDSLVGRYEDLAVPVDGDAIPKEIPAQKFAVADKRPTYRRVSEAAVERGLVEPGANVPPEIYAEIAGELTGIPLGDALAGGAADAQESSLKDEFGAQGAAEFHSAFNLADPRIFTDGARWKNFYTTQRGYAHFRVDSERFAKSLADDPTLRSAVIGADSTFEIGQLAPQANEVLRTAFAPSEIEHPSGSPMDLFQKKSAELDAARERGAPQIEIDRLNAEMGEALNDSNLTPLAEHFTEPEWLDLAIATASSIPKGFYGLNPDAIVGLYSSTLSIGARNNASGGFQTEHPTDIAPGVSAADVKAQGAGDLVGHYSDALDYALGVKDVSYRERLIDRRVENNETIASNEQTVRQTRVDLGVAESLFGLTVINAHDLERAILERPGYRPIDARPNEPDSTPIDSADEPDPEALVEQQLHYLENTRVSDVAPEMANYPTGSLTLAEVEGKVLGRALTAEDLRNAHPLELSHARGLGEGEAPRPYLSERAANFLVAGEDGVLADVVELDELQRFFPRRGDGGSEEDHVRGQMSALAESDSLEEMVRIGDSILLQASQDLDPAQRQEVEKLLVGSVPPIVERASQAGANQQIRHDQSNRAVINHPDDGIWNQRTWVDRAREYGIDTSGAAELNRQAKAGNEDARAALAHVNDPDANPIDPSNPYHDLVTELEEIDPPPGDLLRELGAGTLYNDRFDQPTAPPATNQRGTRNKLPPLSAGDGTAPTAEAAVGDGVAAGGVATNPFAAAAAGVDGAGGQRPGDGEPEVQAAGLGAGLLVGKELLNKGVTSWNRFDSLNSLQLVRGVDGDGADIGLSPYPAAADLSAEINRSMRGTNDAASNVAIRDANELKIDAAATIDAVNGQRAALAVDTRQNAQYVSDQLADRPVAVDEERARMLQGDASTWKNEQRRRLDALVAGGTLPPEQADILRNLRPEQIGLGADRYFVDARGVLYPADLEAFAPVPQGVIDGRAQSIVEAAPASTISSGNTVPGSGAPRIVPDVVPTTTVPTSPEDFLDLSPAEAGETARARFELGTGGAVGPALSRAIDGFEADMTNVDASNAGRYLFGDLKFATFDQIRGARTVGQSGTDLIEDTATTLDQAGSEALTLTESLAAGGPVTVGPVERRLDGVAPVAGGRSPSDVKLYGEQTTRVLDDIGGQFLGVSPLNFRLAKELPHRLAQFETNDLSFSHLDAKLGIDDIGGSQTDALLVTDANNVAFNRAVDENRAINARITGNTATPAAAINADRAQDQDALADLVTYHAGGIELNRTRPDTLDRQRLLEQPEARKIEQSRAANDVIVRLPPSAGHPDGEELRIGDLLPSGTIATEEGAVTSGFYYDESSGTLWTDPRGDALLRARVEGPTAEAGNVPVPQQPVLAVNDLPRHRVDMSRENAPPVVADQLDRNDFEDYLVAQRADLEAIKRQTPAEDHARLIQQYFAKVAKIAGDPELRENAIKLQNGEPVDLNRYPLLASPLNADRSVNEPALGMKPGSVDARVRDRGEIRRALDGVEGAGFDAAPLRFSPSTRKRFGDDVESEPVPTFGSGSEWRKRLEDLQSVNPFVDLFGAPANAAPSSSATPGQTTPDPLDGLFGPNAGHAFEVYNDDANLHLTEYWSERFALRDSVERDLSVLSTGDATVDSLVQGDTLELQRARVDNLNELADSQDTIALNTDTSTRFERSLEDAAFDRTALTDRIASPTTLINLVQKGALEHQRERWLVTPINKDDPGGPTVADVIERANGGVLSEPSGHLPIVDENGDVHVPADFAGLALAGAPGYLFEGAAPESLAVPVPGIAPVIPPRPRGAVQDVPSLTEDYASFADATRLRIDGTRAVTPLKPSQKDDVWAESQRIQDLISSEPSARQAIAATISPDGTYDGQSFDELADNLTFDQRRSIERLTEHRRDPRQYGVTNPNPGVLKEVIAGYSGAPLGLTFTKAPLDRQSLFAGAENRRRGAETNFYGDIERAQLGAEASTRTWLDLGNAENEVTLAENAVEIDAFERNLRERGQAIDEAPIGQESTAAQQSAFSNATVFFEGQSPRHEAVAIATANDPALYERAKAAAVENDIIDEGESYDVLTDPVPDPVTGEWLEPAGYRGRAIGEPPRTEPTNLLGQNPAPAAPALEDIVFTPGQIVPGDPGATGANFAGSYGGGRFDVEGVVRHENRRLGTNAFETVAGEKTLDIVRGGNASRNAGHRPPGTNYLVVERGEEAIKLFERDRGFLQADPDTPGQAEVLEMFTAIGRGDYADARRIVDALGQDPSMAEVVEQFGWYANEEATVLDAIDRAGAVP